MRQEGLHHAAPDYTAGSPAFATLELSTEAAAGDEDQVMSADPPAPWVVYMLVNHLGHTYVGITTDVTRRVRQHNGEIVGGAKATHGRGQWRLLHLEKGYPNRSAAQSREYHLKKDRRFRRTLVLQSKCE